MDMESLIGDNCFRVLDNDKYIIFYFTASWCKPCQSIYPDLLKIMGKLDNQKTVMYKIDIDEDDNKEICDKCNVKSVPTFLLFKNRSLLSNTSGANITNVENMINFNCK